MSARATAAVARHFLANCSVRDVFFRVRLPLLLPLLLSPGVTRSVHCFAICAVCVVWSTHVLCGRACLPACAPRNNSLVPSLFGSQRRADAVAFGEFPVVRCSASPFMSPSTNERHVASP